MKGPLREPERWSNRVPGATAQRRWGAHMEDELGGLFRRVQQATSPELYDLPLATRPIRTRRRRHLAWHLVLAALVVLATGGVVSAARFVWRSITSGREQTLTVPSGSTAVLSGRSRRKLTVVGPARLDLARGGADRVDVALDGGALTVAAGLEPLLVRSAGLVVIVPPEGLGRIAGQGGGAPSVDALAGDLRIVREAGGEEVTLPVAHRWQDERSFSLPESPPAPQGEPPRLVPAAEGAKSTPKETAPAGAPSAREQSIEARREPRREARAPAGETRLLARAFQALRADKEAEAALRALDEWARRFPNGELADQARVARVEALLALGRATDALPLLVEIRDRASGLTRDIQIVRAELLSEQDRCAQAMPDFDDLLADGLHDAADERALYSRAACNLRTGRAALGRRDLGRYLKTYPDGRFAGAVRRAVDDLGPLPPSP
jgi:hypothetical protein